MNPKTDYSAIRFWFDIGQYIIAFLVGFYVWFSNRVNARSEDVEKIGNRLTKLETGAISQTDLAAVYDRVNGISDQVSNLSGKMDGVKGAVDMIQDHLLNKGK